eukprot:jgi/Tetstr1/465869/TSEL_010486.t1
MRVRNVWPARRGPISMARRLRAAVRYRSDSTPRTNRRLSAVPPVSATQGELVPTYSDPGALWASREKDRLLATAPRAPPRPLLVTRGAWQLEVDEADGTKKLLGRLEIHNLTRAQEVFVPEFSASVQLLSLGPIDGITVATNITPQHRQGNGYPSFDSGGLRQDGYWSVYIIKPATFTVVELEVELRGDAAALAQLQSALVCIDYVSYGRHGRAQESQQVPLPLRFPAPASPTSPEPSWQRHPSGAQLLPIATHLLCHADDPVSVVRRYVAPLARPGDVLAIAESPLAIMQGRYRHPRNITPGWLACLLCRLFNPVGSLASACGMQALIDLVGRLRVVVAAVGAVLARLLGRRGVFYQLAGKQAQLIDDITGTMPPYDQFIVLGPDSPERVAKDVALRTGIAVAVVDVNDLSKKTGEAVVLGTSPGVDRAFVKAALLANPQGNADEQTPLVLIRPGPATSA